MLAIGQMSKVCGMSVKVLCHCDKIDLLKPQRIGEINGCRYYKDPQIGTMFSVGRPKWYGFSLTEIQALFTTPDSRELLRRLYKQRFRLKRQTEHISTTIRKMGYHLEESEGTGNTTSYQSNYEIQIKEAEGQIPATRRNRMSMEEFGTYYGKTYEKIAREYMTISRVVTTIYHDQEFDPAYSNIEPGVGITEWDKADFVMPGCLCATTIHKDTYSGLSDAYGAIMVWINANGHYMNGIPYEVYRKTQSDKLPPEEWEAEILFPMEK